MTRLLTWFITIFLRSLWSQVSSILQYTLCVHFVNYGLIKSKIDDKARYTLELGYSVIDS